MKNRKILNSFAYFIAMTLLLVSCDNTEKDWANAKTANTISEYQNFIKNHPKSNHISSAENAIDSLNWIAALKTHNVDSLELFLTQHPSSTFLKTSQAAMDSVEWNLAYYSRDTVRLRKYFEKYPNGNNSVVAKELIWQIQWPPVKVDEAASVIIYSKGRGIIRGQIIYSMSGWFGGGGSTDPTPAEPAVYIWRDFSKDEISSVSKLGLRSGYAYLMPEVGKYKLIKQIDLNKSDEELCAEFGVKSK